MSQAITDSARYALQHRVRVVLGEQEGDTLMAHLPPVGWADVATKQDLTSLRADLYEHFATKADMERGFRRQSMWVATVFLAQQASFVYMVERLAR